MSLEVIAAVQKDHGFEAGHLDLPGGFEFVAVNLVEGRMSIGVEGRKFLLQERNGRTHHIKRVEWHEGMRLGIGVGLDNIGDSVLIDVAVEHMQGRVTSMGTESPILSRPTPIPSR